MHLGDWRSGLLLWLLSESWPGPGAPGTTLASSGCVEPSTPCGRPLEWETGNLSPEGQGGFVRRVASALQCSTTSSANGQPTGCWGASLCRATILALLTTPCHPIFHPICKVKSHSQQFCPPDSTHNCITHLLKTAKSKVCHLKPKLLTRASRCPRCGPSLSFQTSGISLTWWLRQAWEPGCQCSRPSPTDHLPTKWQWVLNN